MSMLPPENPFALFLSFFIHDVAHRIARGNPRSSEEKSSGRSEILAVPRIHFLQKVTYWWGIFYGI